VVRTALVRTLLIVIGMVLIAAATKGPLEPLFVLSTLSLGPQALGLVTASWGLGMLLGSAAAPAAARRWSRERLFSAMIAIVGFAVLTAAGATGLQTVLLAWVVAGAANAMANVSYESLLQERTPDRVRGRVFAAFEAVSNLAFLVGAFLAGWLGDLVGLRLTYGFAALLLLAAAAVAWLLLKRQGVPEPHLRSDPDLFASLRNELSVLDSERRRAALQTLAHAGGDAELLALRRGAEDPIPEIRSMTVAALARRADEEARKLLRMMVFDPVASVAQAAEGALSKFEREA
jgi:MFS family permease